MRKRSLSQRNKIITTILVCLIAGGLGLLVALAIAPDDATSSSQLVRTTNGEVQTGVVETVTVDGEVHRVIRWRTREGTLTETVTGPTQFRTSAGENVYLPGPAVTHTSTTTLPGHTTTLPGQTVTLPAETVTQVNTVTETVNSTVTETVTETVTAPTP